MAMVLVLVLVLVLVTVCLKKKSSSYPDVDSPPSKPHPLTPPKPHPPIPPTYIPYSISDMPSPHYIEWRSLGLHSSLHDSGSFELGGLTPDQDSPCTEVLWPHGEVPHGEVPHGEVPRGESEVPRGESEVPRGESEVPRGESEVPRGESEVPRGEAEGEVPHGEGQPKEESSEAESESVLTCSKESRVLFVYSLNIPESVKKDILSNLVQRLTAMYHIKPVCCDIVSMRENPSKWLLDEVPKADVVLCVLTQNFVQDWEAESTIIGILKMIIVAKVLKKEPFSNFASVILHEDHKKLIPDLLQQKAMFTIDNLPGIGRFIKDIPLCVLPERQ